MSLGEGSGAAHFREFEQLRSRRFNFEEQYREIAERVVPAHSTLFNQYGALETKGEKRTEHLFDATAMVGLDRFGAILDSLLTPSNMHWHKLKADNLEINKNREARLWFDEVSRILFKHRYAPTANFVSQNQQNYQSLGAYGTGCLFVDSHLSGKGLRYRNVHLSEVYFKENHQGIIDCAYRYFPLTGRQARQKWGSELPGDLLEKIEARPDDEFMFLHKVSPREDADPKRLDDKGMPFKSVYICEVGKKELDEGGYRVFPYPISRYYQTSGEVYGRSPAMSVLPSIKTLNEMKKTLLKQAHRAVDPVLLAHDDGILDAFNLSPGALNMGGVDASGRPLVHTLPIGNPSFGRDQVEDERALVNDAFLVNLFQVLTETPEMTATEVVERTKEKGILLAPTVGRQKSEYLGPMIQRELDVLASQPGVLPPMPPILREAGGEYEIEYDSPMSRAQRAEELSGALRSLEHAMGLASATGDPSHLDHFNLDKMIPEGAKLRGMPEEWLRGEGEIGAMRAARAEQAELQQAMQAAPGVAALASSGAKVAQSEKAG